MTPVRAVLVEDSPTQRSVITAMLEDGREIVVQSTAEDVGQATAEVARHRPDVVVMDLDIPGGGGQRAIETIMAETPTPILVLSGVITDARAARAVAALAAGAVDAVPTPGTWTPKDASDLRRQVQRVSRIPVIRRRPPGATRRITPRPPNGVPAPEGTVVGIVASTGGPAALTAVLPGLAGLNAPILVVQHIHPRFSAGFASWLEGATRMKTKMAEADELALPGVVYVAPGDVHLRLGPRRRLQLGTTPHAAHRPSGDELFCSIARHAGRAGVGVVLTGMGSDGAAGLLALRHAGGTTLAQDRASSVIYGMPAAAQANGAAESVLGLDEIAAAVRASVRRRA